MGLKDTIKKLLPIKAAGQQQADADEKAGRSHVAESVASGLTPQKLGNILKAAAEDDPHDFFMLAAEMEERDPHYGSVLSTRKLAVSGVDPEIIPASDDARDLEIAEAVENDILNNPASDLLVADLLDGLGKGIAAVEIIWDTSQPRWKPKAYEWIDQRFFVFDKDNPRLLRLRHKDHPNGLELHPDKFIVHAPRLKSGPPIRNGLARLCVWSYMLKNYSIKDWAHFCEVFGQPVRVGKYGAGATNEDKRSLLRAVSAVARKMAVIIPQNAAIEFITAKMSGTAPFAHLAEYLDKQISKAVVGQTMTADDGSSRAQADIHNDVRLEVKRMDAKQVCATINRDLIEVYVRLNFGEVDSYPKFKIEIAEPEDLETDARILETLLRAGLKISRRQVHDKFGWDEPNGEDDVLGGTNATNEKATHKPALNRAHDHKEDDQLDDIAAFGLADWRAQGDPLLEPIQKALNEVQSFEEFEAALPRLLGQQDAGPLTDELTQATLKAKAEGDAGKLDG